MLDQGPTNRQLGSRHIRLCRALNRRLFKWRQSVDSFCDGLAGNDQICDDAVVDIQVSLVLSQVPYAVTLIEHTPNSRAEVKCLWQQLKYDISVTGAIAVPTESNQAEGVRCDVCKVEEDFER